MAKLFASETAKRAADQAVQIHGGYGFMDEYPVSRYWRNVKAHEIGEGTSEVQRLIIAKNLVGTPGAHRCQDPGENPHENDSARRHHGWRYSLRRALSAPVSHRSGVAAGIVLAGFAAGLGTAKWLPRPWYGRQFTAGFRTSLIAVCMAGISVLLAAFNQGAHSEGQLAASLHALGGSRLGPLISHLAGAGWAVTTTAVVTLAMLLGIMLGVLATLFGAWGKNQHAIQVVNQARLAAQAGVIR